MTDPATRITSARNELRRTHHLINRLLMQTAAFPTASVDRFDRILLVIELTAFQKALRNEETAARRDLFSELTPKAVTAFDLHQLSAEEQDRFIAKVERLRAAGIDEDAEQNAELAAARRRRQQLLRRLGGQTGIAAMTSLVAKQR